MNIDTNSTFTVRERKWLTRTISNLAHDFYPVQITIVNTAELTEDESALSDPIHFLFIDGCHREWVVATIIKVWAYYVVRGGIMAFHDYTSITNVRTAVDNWYASADDWERTPAVDTIIAFKRTTKRISIPLFNKVEAQWQIPVPLTVPA